jgi:hypothetical protein
VLKYGNTKTSFFWLALITTIGFDSFNSASASNYRAISVNDDTFEIKIVSQLSYQDNVKTLDLVADKINLVSSTTHLLSNINQSDLVKSSLQKPQQLNNNFLGDIALKSNQNDSETTEQEQSKDHQNLITIQIISLAFFLLLFIPFGIFYPFLLLYKKLLNIEQQESSNLSKNDNLPFSKPLTTEKYDSKKQEDNSQAVISKLQIACSVADDQLRRKLAKINSNNHLQSEPAIGEATPSAIAELMRKNLAVLIEKQHWTHASYSSLDLSLEEIQTEFDVISCTEKNKFFNQELSLINNGKSTGTNKKFQTKTGYDYLVFTLIICTSTPLFLFEQIYTKEQLIQSLIKLSKLRKDDLIKFELLWNPQEEDEYISNEQLLLEYGDLIRLL